MKKQQYAAGKHCKVYLDQMVVTLDIALFSTMNLQHGPFTSLCPHLPNLLRQMARGILSRRGVYCQTLDLFTSESRNGNTGT